MAEIFHRVRSAGKEFTSEQWGDYCRASRDDPEKRIRTQIGKYLFNDCDVCLNPETMSLVVDGKSFGYYVTLKWCDCGNGVWSYGMDFGYGNGGGGGGCSFATPEDKNLNLRGFPSEREAKIAACDSALSSLERNARKNDAKAERLKRMVEDYKKTISRPQIVQLSLFD